MNWEEKYNAIAELVDGYRRERDEARAETARLRRLLNMAEDELIAADDHGRREAKRADTVEAEVEALKAERDEARAEVERLRELKDYLRTWLSSEELEGLRIKAAEHPLLWEEIHHLKDEVERLHETLEADGET